MGRSAVAIAFLLLLVGCSGGGTVPAATSLQNYSTSYAEAGVSPNAAESAFHHLYTSVCCFNPNGFVGTIVRVYNLPLSANPTPVATLSLSDGIGNQNLAVDSSNLYLSYDSSAGSGNSLKVYRLPIKTAENPLVSDTSFPGHFIAVKNGTLYADGISAGRNLINAYALPFHAGESPSATVDTTPNSPFGLVAGTQFLTAWMCCSSLQTFALPLTAGESAAATVSASASGIAQYANRLYVSNFRGGSPSAVSVFSLPLSNSSIPNTSSVTYGISGPLAVNEHYLYLGGNTDVGIRVYKLPLSPNERTFFTARIGLVDQMVLGP